MSAGMNNLSWKPEQPTENDGQDRHRKPPIQPDHQHVKDRGQVHPRKGPDYNYTDQECHAEAD